MAYIHPQIVNGNTAPRDDPKAISGSGPQLYNVPLMFVYNQRFYNLQDSMISRVISGNNSIAANQALAWQINPLLYPQQTNGVNNANNGGPSNVLQYVKKFLNRTN